MKIQKEYKDNQLTISLEGRLDILTSSELEAALAGALDGVEKLVFDMSKLEYISSAGLRVLLSTQKKLVSRGGQMLCKDLNETVKEVFEVTGFSDIIRIA